MLILKASNSRQNKIQNRNTILKILATKAPISRVALSKMTGLSKMSLTNIISEFKEEGLVVETGIDSTATGKRKPVLLELCDGALCAIGLNITRSYVEGCLVDLKGNMLYSQREELPHDWDEGGLIGTLSQIVKTILHLTKHKVLGIGISSPGPLDLERGMILSPVNFNGVKNVPIVDKIRALADLPVFLYKNNNCAVLAEKYYGEGQNIRNFVYIGVSRGVGCGAVMNDHLLIGETGSACEIGHLTIDPEGEPCGCGNRGCLERYANLVSTVQKAKDAILRGEKTVMTADVTFDKIINAAGENDPLAVALLDDLCKYLAIGVINLINIYNPALVIVGNDIAKGGDLIISRLKKNVGTIPLSCKGQPVDIVMSRFYYKAPLICAATLVFDKLCFA